MKGKILDVERRQFVAYFRPKIKKLCIVHTHVDMDELLAATMEVEKVVREIGGWPYEPLKDEK